ncbi:choline dehydrogenase [Aeromicrobium sp. 636]|uniref:GMC family oxidoreductase N-terminal domain-containing protein n=1 Tax=Aeromicrobium senzhongii TaxID=2663859 RepID=A0A8I0EX81_9ACTN|nr:MULTISPECIES: GMC family oxidoreductase N-terminal domain-containing protein [Aeromicrobium]MBC9227343.1 GMC family oxidoreductase N-terminal domain-containing protein [Aeromicrobium senzhongii]MCQ3999441.1 choline dehydrogenase [Aeromicrobium sp. 636]MTB88247.1 choline dehydrogenase [Aeromicrobium senzhongii]QNL94767.1 GMC family oxidoreductase N-terminal domain-containing protein [Aeromicrobium senzhongii]
MADEAFDYIIIGSGSAGGVLAARLTEDRDRRVLLLEAGPADDDEMIKVPAGFSTLFKTRWDWNYETSPQKHLAGRRAHWPRMKGLGGCSSMNAMIYIRGNAADYDEWRDSYGATGWGHDDVLPYFIKSEANQRLAGPLHGTQGPVVVEDRRFTHELTEAFVESAVAGGLKRNDDFNGAEQEGAGIYQVTNRRGARWSVADAYIRPAMTRPNLTVRTGALVSRILLEGNRATGVAYRSTADGLEHVVRAEAEVIVSAGAINSPQLLMLSGIGPGAHLREHGIDVVVDSPGVGQNLQDHPVAGTLIHTRNTTDLAEAISVKNLLRWKATRSGPLVSNVGEGGAFYTSRDDLALPDIQIHVAPTAFYDNGIHEPVRRTVTIAPTLVNVQSRGSIRLRSADPTWHPAIDPAYFDDPADLDAMLGGYRRMLDLVWQGPLTRLLDEPWEPAMRQPTDDQIIDVVSRLGQTLYHPTSTCAMGTVEGSVVDPQLRVHGVEGLRVADASVMPRVTRGNTNAPTIMIGEKAADLIRGA